MTETETLASLRVLVAMARADGVLTPPEESAIEDAIQEASLEGVTLKSLFGTSFDIDEELDKLASALLELERKIPGEISWVLRVDGHTDVRPIYSAQFRSNWELSAGRAISVVQYLIGKGVSPQRLVAAGFGEFQPIDPDKTEEAFTRNRRIELKLTER